MSEDAVVVGAMCAIEGRCLSGEYYERIKVLEAELARLLKALQRIAAYDVPDAHAMICIARDAIQQYAAQKEQEAKQ